jgi:hypothetical protein
MENNQKTTLRVLTKSIYDLQKLRISTGNRIAGNFRAKLGQEPGQKLEENEAKKIIKQLSAEYARLTDGIVALTPKQISLLVRRKDGVIDNEIEFRLIQSYIYLYDQEKKALATFDKLLDEFPIWSEFLVNVKGVGPTMGAVIISELDPHKAQYVSSFWKYAGIDVGQDGKGRSRKKEHLVDCTYMDAEGNEQIKKGITFNPFLKTKLVGVLAGSFLKAKADYADIYYNYRNRLLNHPEHKEKTKLHQHRMANRYMIKIFLMNLWTTWRRLEGLPVTLPYHEAKLGIVHRE